MTTYYVSAAVSSSGNGTSWATAWKDTLNISWGTLASGDIIEIDGGTTSSTVSPYDFGVSSPNPGVNCGLSYSPFTVGAGNITIRRSRTAGRNGTVVISGGRTLPLPYCGQVTYTGGSSNAAIGIDCSGQTGVTIDGQDRSGIIVRGAQNGLKPGTSGGNTFRNMELFDNGYPTTSGTGPAGGTYNSDGNNILIAGKNTYDRLLVHDGGQDQCHSDAGGTGSDQSGSQVTNCWFGALRAHPSFSYEPFNDLQVAGYTSTHADGWQSFWPNITMTGQVFDHCVWGPGVNQGLYPTDPSGTYADNVTVSNCLFMSAVSHDIETDVAVHGWTISNCTFYAPVNEGLDMLGNGNSVMTNCIQFGGSSDYAGMTWTGSAGNVWWQGTGTLPSSVNANPGFGTSPGTGANVPIAALLTTSLTPSGTYAAYGSPLHSLADLLARIDSLNGSPVSCSGGLSLSPFGLGGSVNTGQAGSIAVDPTTPAVIAATGTTSATITSGTFSPPTATLIAVLTSFEYQSSHASAPVFAVSDSVGGTYTTGPAVFDGTRGATAIWYRYLSSAPGPMTVTVTSSGVAVTHGQILEVLVLSGANPAQQAAAHGMAYSGTGSTAWTGNISTTVPGSWVLLAGAGSTGSALTPNFATLTLENEQDSTDNVSLFTGRQIVPTGSTTTSGGGGGGTTLAITTTTLPGATAGASYSTPLAAAGGTGSGYTWTVSGGSLPAGLTLSAGGTISGTPTTAGTGSFTAKVTDSGSNTATQGLSITVAAAASTNPVGPTGTWTLVFNDEFTGTSLNTTNWTALQGASINSVTTSASAVSVSGGYLRVGYAGAVNSNPASGYAGPSTGPAVVLGNCIEAKINFPNGNNWSAWWSDGSSWPNNGEEDIAEVLGGNLTAFNYHCPTCGPAPGYGNNGPTPGGTWFGGFHTYTLVRGETELQVWWDGVLQRTVTRTDSGGAQAMIINQGTGSSGNTILVEYVRMWTPG